MSRQHSTIQPPKPRMIAERHGCPEAGMIQTRTLIISTLNLRDRGVSDVNRTRSSSTSGSM
jgi:hypothetical protein